MDSLASILSADAEQVARRLLGCELVRQIGEDHIVCRIVETEAYDQSDAASHSFNGETARNSVMFGPAGYLYVYFTYGMHYCMNVVTGVEGQGAAVLIRAAEPLDGVKIIEANRPRISKPQDLTNGPAKLCQALCVGKQLNGHDLNLWPLKLIIRSPIEENRIVQTTRIGITRDSHRPWRFYIADNKFVSKSSVEP